MNCQLGILKALRIRLHKRKNEHLAFHWIKGHLVLWVRNSNIVSLTSKYFSCNVCISPVHKHHHQRQRTFTDALSLREAFNRQNSWVGFTITNTHFQASYPFAYFSEGASINIIKNRSSYLHPIPCYFPSWVFHLALVTIWSLS